MKWGESSERSQHEVRVPYRSGVHSVSSTEGFNAQHALAKLPTTPSLDVFFKAMYFKTTHILLSWSLLITGSWLQHKFKYFQGPGKEEMPVVTRSQDQPKVPKFKVKIITLCSAVKVGLQVIFSPWTVSLWLVLQKRAIDCSHRCQLFNRSPNNHTQKL